MSDRFKNTVIREFNFFGVDTVMPALLRDQMTLRDLKLLTLGITRKIQYLEPVLQCRGDRVQNVSRRDEENMRQVVVDVEVVIAESMILLRVEHLQQRR